MSARTVSSILLLVSVGLAAGGLACVPARGRMPQHTWHPDAPKQQCVDKNLRRQRVKDWPAREAAALQAGLSADRPIVVSALGCKIEVLSQCRVDKGTYRLTEVTPQSRSTLRITGRYDLDRDPVEAGELTGDCARASHFVSAVSLAALAKPTPNRGCTLSSCRQAAEAELTALSLGDYDMSGVWTGVMRQPKGPYEAYDMALHVLQQGRRITGVTTFNTLDDKYWGEMQFEGRIEGNTIFFADAKLLSDNLSWALEWCLKGGYMLVDPRSESLEGLWRAWGCFPGSLELRRTGDLQLEPDDTSDEPSNPVARLKP